MIISAFIFLILVVRFNSIWERRIQAQRTLHAIILPLYHYLGLLDHEIQGEVEEINNLFRQAVLDHVTELRAFLLQPASTDLSLAGKLSWSHNLNNILLALEDSLDEDSENLDPTEISAQVSHLLQFIQKNLYLSKLVKKPLGVVSYSEF